MYAHQLLIVGAALSGLLISGCSTSRTSNTSRTGNEQLLISNAIDQSLDQVDFRPLAGKSVFLDEKYLECTDKNYLVSSIRHRALHAGAKVVPKAEDADLVMEIRSGGVGTDSTETYVGIPGLAVPGPFPISLPEIRMWTRTQQTGIAKIGIAAYDPKTNGQVGQGGMAMARSDNNNWFLMGAGPYQTGSLRKEIERAVEGSNAPPKLEIPQEIAFGAPPQLGPGSPRDVQLTSGDDSSAPGTTPSAGRAEYLKDAAPSWQR